MAGCAHPREPWAARWICKAPALPPAHTFKLILTRIHTRWALCPLVLDSWAAPSPQATNDSHPRLPGSWLGHTQPPFSPSASNTGSVFPLRRLLLPGEPSWPPSLAAQLCGEATQRPPSSAGHRAPVSHHPAPVQASPEWLPFHGPEPGQVHSGQHRSRPRCCHHQGDRAGGPVSLRVPESLSDSARRPPQAHTHSCHIPSWPLPLQP